jgi:hypothetical protein
MAKGDYALVTYSVGDSTEKEMVEAQTNGRRVEVKRDSKWLTVIESTRGGTEVRKAEFRIDSVLSVISKISEE